MPAKQNAAPPMTIRAWLQQQFPTAKGITLKRMIQDGRVLVNGISARSLKQVIGSTDKTTCRSAAVKAEKRPPRDWQIVYEDGDVLVANKPAGLLTSTVADEKRPTLLAMVRSYVAERQPTATVGLIHRLDRASGLLIFSKNADAYESLKRQFFEHSVQRKYIAVVEGVPRQAIVPASSPSPGIPGEGRGGGFAGQLTPTLTLPRSTGRGKNAKALATYGRTRLSESKGRLRSYLIELPSGEIVCRSKPGKGRLAVTDYVVLQTATTRHGPRSMLQVTLQTGRKHQIRAQLSHLGMPIVNDPIYGEVRPTGRMLLTAIKLGILHPRTGQPVKWEIPIPREIKHAMTSSESA